jgi:hypothetical protein
MGTLLWVSCRRAFDSKAPRIAWSTSSELIARDGEKVLAAGSHLNHRRNHNRDRSGCRIYKVPDLGTECAVLIFVMNLSARCP